MASRGEAVPMCQTWMNLESHGRQLAVFKGEDVDMLKIAKVFLVQMAVDTDVM